MTNVNLLYNIGIKYIGNEDCLKSERKTFVVLGVGRGGTSLISGSLFHLGIFTGDLSSPPVFEDIKLASAYERFDYERAEKIIEDYNERYKIWSFKRPFLIGYLEKLHSMLHNPIYLVIFKDLFSVANRNNISMDQDLVQGLFDANKNYAKIINFIGKEGFNGYVFSYDKILNDKHFFADLLVNIIGNHVTKQKKESVLSFIQPNPKEYLSATRITHALGCLDIVQKDYISGWGKYFASDKPAIVELFVNDKYISSVEANLFRKDLLDKKIHSSGCCGFEFKLDDNLRSQDIVNVKISDDVSYFSKPRKYIG